MKKLITAVLLSVIVLTLALMVGCTPSQGGSSDTEALKQNFPAVDGSTYTITLDRNVRKEIFGTYDYVIHSNTYAALQNLKYGQADVVLAGDFPADIENDITASEGAPFELAKTHVANDALVFLVSKDNPVDSITQDNLRKIYAGEIKDWSAVGGNAGGIKTYQRSADSTARNAMDTFMNGKQTSGTQKMLVQNGYHGITETDAQFDGSPNSITYCLASSVISASSRENFKLLKVDGIDPAAQSMIRTGAGAYPLTKPVYAFTNKKSGNGASAKLYIDFLLSQEGQTVVARSGLFNLEGKTAVLPYAETFYAEKGTGDAVTAGALPEFISTVDEHKKADFVKINADSGTDVTDIVKPYIEDKSKYIIGAYPVVDGVKNKSAQDKINAELKNMSAEVSGKFTEFVKSAGKKGEYDATRIDDTTFTPLGFDICPINGYLSVLITLSVTDEAGPLGGNYFSFYTSAVIKLDTGEKVTKFSDLFTKDYDISKVGNYIKEYLATQDTSNDNHSDYELKSAFKGLEDKYFDFTLSSLIFSDLGSYFYKTTEMDVPFPAADFLPYRYDNTALEESMRGDAQTCYSADDIQGTEDLNFALFRTDGYKIPAETAKSLNGIINESFNQAKQKSAEVSITAKYYPVGVLRLENDTDLDRSVRLYSTKTLQPLKLSDIFKEGFESDVRYTADDASPHFNTLQLYDIVFTDMDEKSGSDTIQLTMTDGTTTYLYNVPVSDLITYQSE
jgi:phosphate transport system substrate-binding protein